MSSLTGSQTFFWWSLFRILFTLIMHTLLERDLLVQIQDRLPMHSLTYGLPNCVTTVFSSNLKMISTASVFRILLVPFTKMASNMLMIGLLLWISYRPSMCHGTPKNPAPNSCQLLLLLDSHGTYLKNEFLSWKRNV